MAWISLISLNWVTAVVKEKGRLSGLSKEAWEDALWVSGANLEAGKLWILLTATLDHAGVPHLVNNMLHLAFVGPELEKVTGPTGLWLLFFASGLAGWLTTLAVTRWR
mmetsp:Transcript_25604/g.57433  ORF Transcript_25604/g.57433 Transcript_25604/m.57433 type:complete len:108 (-) Transcript_25604:796-1119(-)